MKNNSVDKAWTKAAKDRAWDKAPAPLKAMLKTAFLAGYDRCVRLDLANVSEYASDIIEARVLVNLHAEEAADSLKRNEEGE